MGQSINRTEDPRLLTGQARYVDDLSLPGMLHAAFVRSPHAHANIVSIDVTAALALDGVVGVYTGEDLSDLAPFVPATIQLAELLAPVRHPLPTHRVRFVGEAIAVVVATSAYIAEDGRDLVGVEWDPLPVVLDPEAAMEPDALLLDETLGTNNICHFRDSAGDVDRAFAEADHVFTKRFVSGRSTGAPVGLRGLVAEYDDRAGGHMTIYPSSQFPHMYRMYIATTLGMPQRRITVKVPDVGGAFGLTCTIFPEDAVVPAVARKLRRPVKWVEDRYENLASSAHSKGMVITMKIATDRDGLFTAFRAHYITDAGAYSAMPFTPLADSSTASGMLPSLYSVRNVDYVIDNPMTNKCHIGPIRGVGWVPGQLARETAIDDIARELDIDPVELRLRNMIGPEPYQSPLGPTYDGGSYKDSLEKVRDTIGYESFRLRQSKLREEGRYIGVGFSPFIEPTGWSTESAGATAQPANFFDTASVTVETDGSVTVTTGFHSHGQGHETTFAQIAADELGVTIESVRILFGDTDSAAFGMGTWASRSAVIGRGAIGGASGIVRRRLLELAGTMLEASADDIELRDGRAEIKGSPFRSVTIGDVAMFGYFGGDARPEDVQQGGLTATSAYEPGQTYANGCRRRG